MKKIGVNIDFVAFGELDEETTKKLTTFNETVKSSEGSYLSIIHPGPGLLSDQLITTPILNGDGPPPGGMGDASGGGDGGSFEFGIDPSVDPELALALRMSMEEEKARVDKQNKDKADAEGKDSLPGIKEEDEASQPLLNKNGEASGSKDDKKDDKDEEDKMDTA